ncbi:MAG: flippase [Variovorax sp.]
MSLRRNTLWNLAGAGLPLAVGAAVVPYLIRESGVEAFGILTLVWALIGYFSLFDLGLGRALTQKMAQRLAGPSPGDVHGIAKSGVLLATATGVAGGLLLAALAEPFASDWLKVSASLQQDAFHALLIAAACVPVTTATIGMRGVLEAYEDFRDVNLLRMVLGLANFGLPALSVLWLGPSLLWMVASLMAARVLICIAHAVLVRRRLGPGFLQAPLTAERLNGLVSFGLWMTVSNIVSPLMVTADRFVISATLGAAVVAFYTVPAEVMARLLILPGALTNALFPRLASLMAHDPPVARRLYLRCVALVALAMLPVSLALIFGANAGLALWLGAEFAEKSAPVLVVLAVGLLLNGVAFVPFAAVQAAGHARLTAQLHLAELAIYVPLLLFALQRFGLAGAAMAWTARVGIDLVLLLVVAHRRAFAAAER